jgi:hypothetical protein
VNKERSSERRPKDFILSAIFSQGEENPGKLAWLNAGLIHYGKAGLLSRGGYVSAKNSAAECSYG